MNERHQVDAGELLADAVELGEFDEDELALFPLPQAPTDPSRWAR